MTEPLRAGDRAPDFTLPSTAGDVSLHAILDRGDRAVIAFYFEDATPSYETELSMLRDSYDLLREYNAGVIAISTDSVASHAAFAERMGGVPFALAADAALDAARAYGVVDEGDPRRARRAVFVVDRDGTVLLALPQFQPNNLTQVEAIFNALNL